jgi:hypothetical protein
MKKTLIALLVGGGLGFALAQSTSPISDSLASAKVGLRAADTEFNNQLAQGNGVVTYSDLVLIQSFETSIASLQAKYQGR